MSTVKMWILSLLLTASINIAITQNSEWLPPGHIYQIYVRSFMDSDNDGNGDIQGIINKLDHIQDSGVTKILLSPIQPSPPENLGYDPTDWLDVNPIYGNQAVMHELITQATARDIKVLLEFVPNHTSDQHTWFGRSARREPGFENYYVWKNGRGNNQPPNNWANHKGEPAWTYNSERGQWYFHQFSSNQPDLNYREPRVVQHLEDCLTFWFLTMQIDGFKLNDISFLFEDENYPDGPLPQESYSKDQQETYELINSLRYFLESGQFNDGVTRPLIVDTHSNPDKLFRYYGDHNLKGAHLVINNHFIDEIDANSNARDVRYAIQKWITYTPLEYTATWLLGGHDRQRLATRFEPQLVDGLNMLILFLPGISIIASGDELGMTDGEAGGTVHPGCDDDRNSCKSKSPFQWSADANAGFNQGGTSPWLPVAPSYGTINLEQQMTDAPKSHYGAYREQARFGIDSLLLTTETETMALTKSVLLVRKLRRDVYFVLVMNFSGQQQVVDAARLGRLPESLEIISVSSASTKTIRSNLLLDGLVVEPYEAIMCAGFGF